MDKPITNGKEKKTACCKDADEKEKMLQDYQEHLQRLQAEFDNYRKRVEREREEICKIAGHELVYKMLTIIDSFELALQNKEKSENFVKGVEMIYSQLYSILEKEGVRKIEALNKKFDANYHEVLLVENDEKKDDDVVVEELQGGYMLNGKVLRYAKVKINKRLEGVK